MKIKLIFLVVFCAGQFASNTYNNSNNTTHSLIGKWLRSDFTESFEYQIHFEENNFGKIVNRAISDEGIISSVTEFKWTKNNNSISITQDGQSGSITTSVTYSKSGNLILPNFSELEFIRQ